MEKQQAQAETSTTTATTGTASSSSNGASSDAAPSALRDNIARKGKNAYYFAHAHKANGPEWDGKVEPKLLSKTSDLSLSENGGMKKNHSTFDLKSNITSYAFSDEGKTVKLYITMEGVGDICQDEDITLDFTPTSFCFRVNNYVPPGVVVEKQNDGATAEPKCLSFLKLTADITKATYKKKKDRIIVILHKQDPDLEWHTINDKGEPDHEVV